MFVRMLNEAEPPAIEFVEHEINDGVRRHKLGVPPLVDVGEDFGLPAPGLARERGY